MNSLLARLEALEAGSREGTADRTAVKHHQLDVLYRDFEARFRGTHDDIKGRVRVYLPKLAAANVGSPQAPVLDIGCGRGEWLELLKESGLSARGVARTLVPGSVPSFSCLPCAESASRTRSASAEFFSRM